MSHPEVESNPGEASSSVLWEHSSKRERSQVDKQRPRVSLQKSEAGKRYRAGPGVPVCAPVPADCTRRQRQDDHSSFQPGLVYEQDCLK